MNITVEIICYLVFFLLKIFFLEKGLNWKYLEGTHGLKILVFIN